MNDNENCQRGSKIESRPSLLGWELQELIVWMVMRLSRQQMLACLYNPNPTNKFLPLKLSRITWHPGDGDRLTFSHLPPARTIVYIWKRKKIKNSYDRQVDCCLLQWFYGARFIIVRLLKHQTLKKTHKIHLRFVL